MNITRRLLGTLRRVSLWQYDRSSFGKTSVFCASQNQERLVRQLADLFVEATNLVCILRPPLESFFKHSNYSIGDLRTRLGPDAPLFRAFRKISVSLATWSNEDGRISRSHFLAVHRMLIFLFAIINDDWPSLAIADCRNTYAAIARIVDSNPSGNPNDHYGHFADLILELIEQLHTLARHIATTPPLRPSESELAALAAIVQPARPARARRPRTVSDSTTFPRRLNPARTEQVKAVLNAIGQQPLTAFNTLHRVCVRVWNEHKAEWEKATGAYHTLSELYKYIHANRDRFQ